MRKLTITNISYGSEMYELTKSFRNNILRLPLGLTLSEEDIKGEDQQIHISALANGKIIGTVLLKPLPLNHIKLRQMAVDPVLQRQGIGKQLVQYAERFAQNRKFQIIEMHARVSAKLFYEKLGYQAMGIEFIEVTVPTTKMIKIL